MAVRKLGRVQSVLDGWDVLGGDFACAVCGSAFVAGLGAFGAAALGADLGDRGWVLGIDSFSVWDGVGDLYVVGFVAGEFGAGV